MRIILTHEQADFDALASLLGAALLDDAAVPVMPSRMNRNVRAFLNLYEMELPFVERRDLPNELIEAVTLVDTQSLVSVRGMSAETRVHIVDHHPPRGPLPPGWTITNVDTGATTTIFVEELQERNGLLSIVHATLLLMGIYEDTGSLTYTRTTSRDLRAAAFLVEAGADLRISVDFLNHPLSLRQQELYDQLRAASETYSVNGRAFVVACGDVQGMDEELSTVVHKLRDLLDPDALICLIKTRGGIQLIARSTTDSIDVARLAEHFGGGGHARAAAGLIHDREMDEVHKELIDSLSQYARPAITVAEIMSRGPQVLSPETTVQEAAERMQRYGYEGYPVVSGDRVVGLLTRRAVDRALAHKLNLTASSLMEAGEVTVRPDDSIEYLQRVMTDTGWGQVPVIQPGTGKIIGIVTRTDLLKTLAMDKRLSGYQNLSSKLESVLPPGLLALLKRIAEVAHEQHSALYIVGGFVRDLLLERPSQDFDLVVEGDAIALANGLASRFGGRVTSHARFGTAKWFLHDQKQVQDSAPVVKEKGTPSQELQGYRLPGSVDLISARTEFYTHPSALPTVEKGGIKLDLHRRDFTINTLALRLDGRHYGELHDYWGGLDDLRQGLVRSLHSLSFVDDPTRMLRAVRFEQRFGFQIEERTLELLKEAASLIGRVSGDRIRHELDHILDEDEAAQMLKRLNDLALLSAIHPDLVWDQWLRSHLQSLNGLIPPALWKLPGPEGRVVGQRQWNRMPLKRALSYILWLIRLPPERAEGVIERLRLPHSLASEILVAFAVMGDIARLVGAPASLVARRLEDVSPLALYAVYLASSEPDRRALLESYMSHWRGVHPTINGRDLLAMGVHPGPEYKHILSALRAAWLDGKITSVEEERALLEELVLGKSTEKG